jgi:hypothetical protein
MPSITTWTRLEPRPRGADLTPSLEARVYDPAWLLARQWQVAEFRGQDAAFPVSVSYQIRSEPPLTSAGAAAAVSPLDAAAAEPAATPTPAESAESAAQLIELLRDASCPQALIDALVSGYPLAAANPALSTPAGQSYLAILDGRLPDATALRPLLGAAVAAGTLPDDLASATDDPATALAVFGRWLAAPGAASGGAAAWQPDQLSYQLGVDCGASDGGHHLAAPQWDGEELDWFDFDVDAAAVPPAASVAATQISGDAVPHPLSYPGMPDHRWWAFEDAQVNLAGLQLGPTDIARMLVVEFAGLLSADWYLHPVRVPLSSFSQVTELVVTDSFGTPRTVHSADAPAPVPGDWTMFAHGTLDGTANADGLFLPAVTVAALRSAPVEQVDLVRDDSADLAWALEQAVTSDDGQVIDRPAATAAASPPPAPRPPDPTMSAYELESTLAAYQFALVPPDQGQPSLVVLEPPATQPDGSVSYAPPLGRLLAELTISGLRQEEVPAEGVELTRRFLRGRGFDGSVVLWTARSREITAAPPTPVISFDIVTPGPGTPPVISQT